MQEKRTFVETASDPKNGWNIALKQRPEVGADSKANGGMRVAVCQMRNRLAWEKEEGGCSEEVPTTTVIPFATTLVCSSTRPTCARQDGMLPTSTTAACSPEQITRTSILTDDRAEKEHPGGAEHAPKSRRDCPRALARSTTRSNRRR